MPIAAWSPNFVALLLAAVVFALSAWAEWIHARRSAALGRLAFGPTGEPRSWTKAAPLLRVVAGSLLAWGLVILALSPSEALSTTGAEADEPAPEDLQRIILLLDVSPSMAISDSGENRNLERRQRVLQVVKGIFPRISVARTRFSIIAFFTSARPVVVDSYDTAVITNVLDNLPLVWAFEPGKTDVIKGLQATADMARDWAPKSTTVILCTDGDTVDFSQIPKMPRSVSQVQIFAVGDPVVGTFIDGHDSRQQAGVLRRLAAELRGSYYDVNTRHVPTSALTELAVNPPKPAKLGFTWKDLALGAIAIGATILALLPLLLEYFGCAWNAGRELPASRPREMAA
ncbi:vWA domain-containing protein [Anatilimnocola floriformis]|uniref:vWA domain-containing protein n=1 Tax=Anatilimnocola floriformis TaxID=2948575 RepID=UPI0020C4E48E|nr:vWA domain-containing protein [Anatilimnocola floriformis]